MPRRQDLETTTIELERASFVAGGAPGGPDPFRARIRIRHRGTPIAATVRPASAFEPARGGRWLVETDTPVWAAARRDARADPQREGNASRLARLIQQRLD